MFANTLTITIDGIARVLTRVNQDNYGSLYQLKDATQKFVLQFRNGTDKASPENLDRHTMVFEHTVYATATTTEKYYSMTSTIRCRQTSDPTWLGKVATGFITLLAAQKDGMIAGES